MLKFVGPKGRASWSTKTHDWVGEFTRGQFLNRTPCGGLPSSNDEVSLAELHWQRWCSLGFIMPPRAVFIPAHECSLEEALTQLNHNAGINI